MTKFLQIIFFLTSFFCLALLQAQSITNVQATQEGTNIVVTYDLTCDFDAELGLYMSEDGGTTYTGPLKNTSGDVGKGISEGKKKVVWNALAEKDMFISKNVSFSIQGVANRTGKLVDSRDGQVYKIVKIGTQIWMAQNLNFNIEGSICYKNEVANCNYCGKLYDFNTSQKVCPTGWHLPKEQEFEVLINKLDKRIHFFKDTTLHFDLKQCGYFLHNQNYFDGLNTNLNVPNWRNYNSAFWEKEGTYRVFATQVAIYNGGNPLNKYSVRCLKD